MFSNTSNLIHSRLTNHATTKKIKPENKQKKEKQKPTKNATKKQEQKKTHQKCHKERSKKTNPTKKQQVNRRYLHFMSVSLPNYQN